MIGAGGPTIFDLVSGALSKGEKFIDVLTVLEREKQKSNLAEEPFTFLYAFAFLSTYCGRAKKDLEILESMIKKLKTLISQELGLTNHYFTKPLFFSRIDDRKSKTFHDEVWTDQTRIMK